MSDQLSPYERQLLDALQADDTPDASEQQRVKQRVFSQLGLGVATVAASAAVGSTVQSAAALPTAAGVAQVGAAAGAQSGAAAAGGSVAAAGSGSAAMGAAAGGGAVAGANSATAGWVAVVTAKLGTVKGIVGLSVALAAAGGGTLVALTGSYDPVTPPAQVSEADAPPAPPLLDTPAVETERDVEGESAEALAATNVVHPPPAAPKRVTKPKASEMGRPGPSSLQEESALMSRAQQAIGSGRPKQAIGLLLEHQKRFPSGTLRLERQAALAIARCQSGQVARGAQEAARFREAHPNSPMVQRLETACKLSPR